MKTKFIIVIVLNVLFFNFGIKPVYAHGHTQQDRLFSMDIPAGWQWIEYPQEIVIAFPDGKTMAIDIQFLASRAMSQADMKKSIKEGNDKMIREGIEAHHGTLIDNKETTLDGAYATQLDFRTAPPNPVSVTYISFFHKSYAFTITYASLDDKTHAVMDDAVATIKLR